MARILTRPPRAAQRNRPRRSGALLVPGGGLEPPRPRGHMTLNHARLPIPPSRRTRKNHGIRLPPDCQGKRRARRRKPQQAPQAPNAGAGRGVRSKQSRTLAFNTGSSKSRSYRQAFSNPRLSLFPYPRTIAAHGPGESGSTPRKGRDSAAAHEATRRQRTGAGAANPTAVQRRGMGPESSSGRALAKAGVHAERNVEISLWLTALPRASGRGLQAFSTRQEPCTNRFIRDPPSSLRAAAALPAGPFVVICCFGP